MQQFKTESQKILDLVINSIYTNREIFLRELISNASDAVDKLYFKSLTDDSVKIDQKDLAINVAYDHDARTITISDNGIGMTAAELEENLGTIAHSGSQAFKAENAEAQGADVDIIGQFGVGFYSAFMVADQVEVISRAYGSDEANRWVSDGIEGYTIEPATRDGHGTTIILHIKDSTEDINFGDYLSESTLRELIKRYSNYVRYPIQMMCKSTRQKPKPEDADDDYKPEYETVEELKTINSMIPIWKRSKSDVTEEEYNEFYKTDFHDWEDPMATITVHAEGALSYDALLFIPSKAPFDLYSKDYKKGLALYSSNVLIQEKCEELLPDYFNFVRGVVDSQDLTLNISRETLQHNNQLKAIARRVEKKVKAELLKIQKNEREKYENFFRDFGRGIKFGIYSSYGMDKDKLQDLLMFYSASQKKMVTLEEYVAAMPEEQKAIYYSVGESTERLSKLPIVNTVLSKGYDVLLCTEDLDEFTLGTMHDYSPVVAEGEEAKNFEYKNVAGGDLGLETEDEKEAAEAITKQNTGLFDAMKGFLGEEVTKVCVSSRLTDAAACVTAEGPVSLEMEKAFYMQPGAEEIKAERVLELNPQHEVFKVLQAANEAGDTEKLDVYTTILYANALLVEGLPIADPVAYSQAVCNLMK